MLSENIKTVRKAKGLSQEGLAIRLNVVRQTVSKWEQGLSVPDADLLIALSEVLETSVSTLLGDSVAAPQADGLQEMRKNWRTSTSDWQRGTGENGRCFPAPCSHWLS